MNNNDFCCENANIVVVSVFQPSDAQTLADIARGLRNVHLSVSHTDCTALSTLCSLPSVKELWVIVRSNVKASPCLFGAAMAFCLPTQYTLLVLSDTIDSAIVSIVQTYCNMMCGCPVTIVP